MGLGSVPENGRVRATGGTCRLKRGLANTRAMRNGQNKRMRGRNRKSHNPLTRVYESNGPDVKIRGSAVHIADKYVQLARDAQSSGDPISAENYHQHAEHYFRLIASAQEQFRQPPPFFRGEGGMDMRADMGADMGEDDEEETAGNGGAGRPAVIRNRRSTALPAARRAILFSPRAAEFLARAAEHFPRAEELPREQQNFSREPRNFPREPQGYNRHGQGQPAPVAGAEENGAASSDCLPSSPAAASRRHLRLRRRPTRAMARTASKARAIVFRCTGADAVIAGRAPTWRKAARVTATTLRKGHGPPANNSHHQALSAQPARAAPPREGANTGSSTGLSVGTSFFLPTGIAR